jgi:3-dehydroquinate synthase
MNDARRISLDLSRQRSDIWVGNRLSSGLEKVFRNEKKGKAFFIIDRKLKKQATPWLKQFQQLEWNTHVYFAVASEKFKDIKSIFPLYQWLLQGGADRSSILIAVGGGVIGDATGFLAGTYMRGIRWAGIPTTLLAQVDSAVGGKTAVNHPQSKNLIGVFHQPSWVFCDGTFLNTLPKRDRVSGLGEMIKYGLAFSPHLFNHLETQWKKVISGSLSGQNELIYECLKLKSKMVRNDELDCLGIREVLNLGHTFGHALEAETEYSYFRHGEAVILGLRVAAHLSLLRKHLNPKKYQKIESFLSLLPVPSIPKSIKTENLISRLKSDKKVRNGKVRFVLLRDIGKTSLDDQVTPSQLLECIGHVRNEQ